MHVFVYCAAITVFCAEGPYTISINTVTMFRLRLEPSHKQVVFQGVAPPPVIPLSVGSTEQKTEVFTRSKVTIVIAELWLSEDGFLWLTADLEYKSPCASCQT